MAILLVSASAFFFYSTSKYFPLSVVGESTKGSYSYIYKILGTLMALAGVVVLAQMMSITTAIITAAVVFMTLLPLLIFSLSLYPKSWIGWGIVLTVVVTIDLAGYAG